MPQETPNDSQPKSRNPNSLKDPAQPHPDDSPAATSSQTPAPANQRYLTTVHNLEGYTSRALSLTTPLGPTNIRPSLPSILKKLRDHNPDPLQHDPPQHKARSQLAQSIGTTGNNSLPSDPPIAPVTNPQPPQYRHLFQPILSPRHTVIPRPYIPAPQPHDVEGQPWCAGCTAQLSDDDPRLGIRDPANPAIRYRLRRDQDQPPTHSNLHNDLTRIHRTNADYHRSQRETEELQQATHGTLPHYRPLTTYINTPSAANVRDTIDRYQYNRYQQRGGRAPQGDHRLDFTYNSPNVTNMNPGNPYRQWFHNTISSTH